MKHLLMDPAFPDIVGESARGQPFHPWGPANDDFDGSDDDEFVEAFLLEIARREIDATRSW